MLVEGKWTEDWQPVQAADAQGRFLRQRSVFRGWLTADGAPGPAGQPGFEAVPGRYHLYVALICPWACRVLMMRVLKRLEHLLPVTVANPVLSEQGWRFGGGERADEDPLHGATYLHQLYTRADPHYTGRATVPVLWDRLTDTIVNNESADLVAMLDEAFAAHAEPTTSLRPRALRDEMAQLDAWIYETLNNGVYRAGFATSQDAYEEAVLAVFETLDKLETRLAAGGPYLFGERFTTSDVRLFVTLARFDTAYHGVFKCNLRRIVDYPALHAYLQRVHELPGIADTVELDHIRRGYYSIRTLNPNGIVPLGPSPSPFER